MTQAIIFVRVEPDFLQRDPRMLSLTYEAKGLYMVLWTMPMDKVPRTTTLEWASRKQMIHQLAGLEPEPDYAKIKRCISEIERAGLIIVGENSIEMLGFREKHPGLNWKRNKGRKPKNIEPEPASEATPSAPDNSPTISEQLPDNSPTISEQLPNNARVLSSTLVRKEQRREELKSKAVSRPSLDTQGEEFPTSEPRYPKNAADAAIAVACATVSATAPEFEEEDKDVQVLKTLIQTYREPLGRKARATILQARFGIHAKVVPRLLDIGEERLLLAAAFVLLSQREGAIRNVAGALVNYSTANPIPESGEREACDLLRRARRNGQYRVEGALQPLQGDGAQKRPQAPP